LYGAAGVVAETTVVAEALAPVVGAGLAQPVATSTVDTTTGTQARRGGCSVARFIEVLYSFD